jgi:hypothetical protein
MKNLVFDILYTQYAWHRCLHTGVKATEEDKLKAKEEIKQLWDGVVDQP